VNKLHCFFKPIQPLPSPPKNNLKDGIAAKIITDAGVEILLQIFWNSDALELTFCNQKSFVTPLLCITFSCKNMVWSDGLAFDRHSHIYK
jgi:hypothetical protein